MGGSESRPGSSLAIVAIPREDDYVWKISSEKVPHMTILFLGDQSNNPNVGRMTDFLEHVAATSMESFGQDVDRRGLLGSEDADVLYFGDVQKEMLNNLRGYLLTNQHIFEAYNSTEQYPQWTRHLTLGYPKTPAKPDNRDYPGISWVNFDRIAIWTGDYEGPTFQLPSHSGLEVSMSDVNSRLAREILDLEHVGVKGMHWGVRKDSNASKVGGLAVKGAKALKEAKADPTKKSMSKHVKATGGLHKVDDDTLKVMISRMEMEKKFNNFMKEDAKRRADGAKAVGKVLGEIGKIALPVLLTFLASQGMKNRSASGSVFRTAGFVNKGNVIEGVTRAIGS